MLLTITKFRCGSSIIRTPLRINGAEKYTKLLAARSLSSFNAVGMPSLSPTMTHGSIARWSKKEGDVLKAGDILCEIETDKASVGYEVQDDGILAKIIAPAQVRWIIFLFFVHTFFLNRFKKRRLTLIHIPYPNSTRSQFYDNIQGGELKCGDPIAITVEDEAALATFLKLDPSAYSHLLLTSSSTSSSTSSAAPTSSTPSPNTSATATPVPAKDTSHATITNSNAPRRLSPAARHLAETRDLDLNKVVGTSKGGLISKSDLVNAVKAGIAVPKAAGTSQSHAVGGGVSVSSVAPTPSHSAVSNKVTWVDEPMGPINNNYVDIPNSNMRKVIAKRLTESKATVPHFYTSIECEIDELLAMRTTLKKSLDVNVSVNDLVIKAAAQALRDVQQANSKWNKATNSVTPGSAVDISVAVATPNGLITPIVTGADRRGVAEISSCVKDLAGRAREGKLKPEEYQGGSFSISNLGMFGITSFSAVINPPQACILAVGAGVPRVLPPKKEGDEPRVGTTVTVQLSADRRVVNEAIAAQFLQIFRGYFSSPKNVLL